MIFLIPKKQEITSIHIILHSWYQRSKRLPQFMSRLFLRRLTAPIEGFLHSAVSEQFLRCNFRAHPSPLRNLSANPEQFQSHFLSFSFLLFLSFSFFLSLSFFLFPSFSFLLFLSFLFSFLLSCSLSFLPSSCSRKKGQDTIPGKDPKDPSLPCSSRTVLGKKEMDSRTILERISLKWFVYIYIDIYLFDN